MDLSTRSTHPEELDNDSTPSADYQQCMSELAVINRLILTHWLTLRWLAKATKGMTEFSLLDVGYGDGDLLRAVAGWAERRRITVLLHGIDKNPRSADAARSATPNGMDIAYITGDVFDYIPTARYDFIVSSQFTHHLDDDGVVAFLRWAEANSVRGWHIADLHRHALPHRTFPLLCRIMGWHRITREDGRISIARSFRRADWARYLEEAALDAKVSWQAFRLCVSRLKMTPEG